MRHRQYTVWTRSFQLRSRYTLDGLVGGGGGERGFDKITELSFQLQFRGFIGGVSDGLEYTQNIWKLRFRIYFQFWSSQTDTLSQTTTFYYYRNSTQICLINGITNAIKGLIRNKEIFQTQIPCLDRIFSMKTQSGSVVKKWNVVEQAVES